MIVGFVGKKGSGKSTAAEFLENEHGFMRVNFKDALVAELKHKMPLLLDEILNLVNYEKAVADMGTVNDLFVEKPPVIRALLQNYGTEVRRADDPEYWVDAWRNLVNVLDKTDIVVDDVRFENEAQAVRDMGGCLIRIIKEGEQQPVDTHASETEQDSIVVNHDVKVNAGEIDKLKELVFKAVFVD